ncbi:MAG TPA: hypothetical protein VNI84_10265 [Pyrinomonadaceae bacterium]|nr:hypothetical protein [Pyrinomonadaceae bacterium]
MTTIKFLLPKRRNSQTVWRTEKLKPKHWKTSTKPSNFGSKPRVSSATKFPCCVNEN